MKSGGEAAVPDRSDPRRAMPSYLLSHLDGVEQSVLRNYRQRAQCRWHSLATGGAVMNHFLGCVALAGVVGCMSSPAADPTVGSGSFSRNGTSLAAMAVWATTSYAFFGSGNDSYGGYAIRFSTTGAGIPCSGTSSLSTLEQLDISTPQVFTPASGGRAKLSVGDIPVVHRDPFDNGPPAMTVAEFYASSPTMTAGTVTITSFDSSSIAGTFAATGPDSSTTPSPMTTFSGSFDATICPSK
jgi:hypothetical protein